MVDIMPVPLKMVAIHGSARASGNSWRLLNEAIGRAKELRPDIDVEMVRAYGANVDPCVACEGCNEDQVGCTVGGDGWHHLEGILRSADILLLSSPVYFMGLPAPLKAIVDRLQALWWYRERGGKVATNEGPFRRAGLILVAAGGETVFDPSRKMAMAAINTLGFDLHGELMAGGLEEPDEAGDRLELVEEARRIGARLVE
jgi:multimeric flavodoxin WrbA